MKPLLLQVGVKVLLKNDKNQYLFIKRSVKKYSDSRGVWDIPGGRIVTGVGLIENLKREVLEETRLMVFDKPRLLFAQDIILSDKHVIRLTYSARTRGDPVLSDEHTEHRWLTMKEIHVFGGIDSYLKEAISEIGAHEFHE